MRRPQPALPQLPRRVVAELHLADADTRNPGRTVRREVLLEGRRERRGLANRQAHSARLNRRRCTRLLTRVRSRRADTFSRRARMKKRSRWIIAVLGVLVAASTVTAAATTATGKSSANA